MPPITTPPPAPAQRETELSVRDQSVLAVFFGVYLGVDTRRWPKLTSGESLALDVLEQFERGPFGGQHWSLLRFGAYRSAAAAIEPWGLVLTTLDAQGRRDDDPALPGSWWIDGNVAVPRNAGVMRVSAATFAPLVVSAAAEQEREALAAELGTPLRGPVGWHVLSLVNLKHT
ncbi:hypothetical protein [Polyangium aurulentum]|uniref:hypothetical protein n=1 Tax=Polyangium aurulentum TaxID=2567896 RepID=UPI0010ADB011|nr:hypothetical protein [Polyangium aurulentum]UQA57863.1 hypothetical protein E8A73_042405 [Polyangium aurulentum]